MVLNTSMVLLESIAKDTPVDQQRRRDFFWWHIDVEKGHGKDGRWLESCEEEGR